MAKRPVTPADKWAERRRQEREEEKDAFLYALFKEAYRLGHLDCALQTANDEGDMRFDFEETLDKLK